jgi:hypothetical protein
MSISLWRQAGFLHGSLRCRGLSPVLFGDDKLAVGGAVDAVAAVDVDQHAAAASAPGYVASDRGDSSDVTHALDGADDISG